MAKTIQMYSCEICGRTYENLSEAMDCEEREKELGEIFKLINNLKNRLVFVSNWAEGDLLNRLGVVDTIRFVGDNSGYKLTIKVKSLFPKDVYVGYDDNPDDTDLVDDDDDLDNDHDFYYQEYSFVYLIDSSRNELIESICIDLNFWLEKGVFKDDEDDYFRFLNEAETKLLVHCGHILSGLENSLKDSLTKRTLTTAVEGIGQEVVDNEEE